MDQYQRELAINAINASNKNTVGEVLGFFCTDISEDTLTISMEVGPKVHQPFGIMNGGISAVLAESAGSMLAALDLPTGKTVVGLQIISNHLKAISSGMVYAKAHFVKKGRTIQITQIDITNEKDELISHSTLTTMWIDINFNEKK